MRNLFLIALCAGAVACTTVSQQTSIATPLRASEYNSIASRYLERPTYVTLQSMSDGAQVLRVTMDEYGYGAGASIGQDVALNYAAAFDSRYVDQYLAHIAKYEEWAGLASQRGDMIEKEIGKAPTWANMGTGKLRFEFFSSGLRDHYLVVGFCLTACVNERLMFDRDDVAHLKKALLDLKAGKIQQLDVDSVYK